MPITLNVQDPKNVQRVVNERWDRVIERSPSVIGLLGTTAWKSGSGGQHEWVNRYYGPKRIVQSSATGAGVATITPVSDLQYFQVGDTLQLEDDSLIVQVTAITATDMTLAILARAGSNLSAVPTGNVAWLVLPRDIKDGSNLYDGQTDFKQDKIVWNGIQTYRSYVQMDATLQDTATWDGASQLSYQLDNLIQRSVRDLNKSIILGPRRRRSIQEASLTGSCGGFAWLSTVGPASPDYPTADGMAVHTKITPGPLLYTDIRETLQMLHEWENARYALVVHGTTQAYISENWTSGLAPVLQANITSTFTEQLFGKFVNRIINPFTGTIIPVVVDNNMPKNQAFLFNVDSVKMVYRMRPEVRFYGPRELVGYDGNTAEIMAKWTIEWLNSFANVAAIYNIAV